MLTTNLQQVISTLVIQSAFTLKSTVQIILWGLVGLSPYLQLPLSSFFFEPRITWGDHSSSQYNDFPGHVTSELSTMAGYVAGRMDSATLVDNAQRFFYGSCRDLTIVVWVIYAHDITIYKFGCYLYFWCSKRYRLGNPNTYNVVILQYSCTELYDEVKLKHNWFLKYPEQNFRPAGF